MDDIDVAGLHAVVISYQAAGDLVKALDDLRVLARRRGAVLPAKLVSLRDGLDHAIYHGGVRVVPRVDADTGVDLGDWPQAEGGLVDTAAAAAELGITPDAIRWHCHRGVFRHSAVLRGRRWWIPVDDVAAEAAARQRI